MKTIKAIIEESQTIGGKVFDYSIQGLILISLVTFSISTLPHLSEESKKILDNTEIIIVAIFSMEYLLRIIVNNHPFKYIFSFYGVIDLLAILPFYIASGIDLSHQDIQVYQNI